MAARAYAQKEEKVSLSSKRLPPDALEGQPVYKDWIDDKFEFEDVSPLFDRSNQPAKVFPLDALGDELKQATEAIHNYGIAHMSTCASAVLGSISASISPHLDIDLWDKQSPTVIWVMHLAESGTGKTQVCNQAFGSFRDADKERQLSFTKRVAEWRRDNERRKVDDSLPVKEHPQNWRRWLEDITVAKLARRLSNSSLAVVWLVDEGATFTDGYDFKSGERRLSAAATLSKLFDAEQISYSRAVDNTDIAVYGRRLCISIFTQTVSGLIWAQQPQLNANGLCARFLMSMAEERSIQEVNEEALKSNSAYQLYQSKLKVFEDRPLKIKGGDDPPREDFEPHFDSAELDPFVADFSTEASRYISTLSKEWRVNARGIPEASPMKSFYLRSAEHVARLSALLCAYENGMEWLYQNSIDVSYVERAKKIVEWFHSERLRIVGSDNQNTDDDTETLASILLQWLGDAKEMLSFKELSFIRTREVSQRGPNALRKREKRDRVVEYLREHGYIAEHKVGKNKYLVVNPDA